MRIFKKSIIFFIVFIMSAACIPSSAHAHSFSPQTYDYETPSAPTEFKARSFSYNTIKLNWHYEDYDADGFIIYIYSASKSQYIPLTRLDMLSCPTEWDDDIDSSYYWKNSKLPYGAVQYYKIRAYNDISAYDYVSGTYVSQRLYSNEAGPVSAVPLLSKSKIKSLKSKKAKTAKINWKKVTGASGYQLFRSGKKNGKYKKIKDIRKTSCTDKKLKGGTKYYYKIRAYIKISGKKQFSSFSGKKSVTVKRSNSNKKSNTGTGGTVYITESGSKFHRAGCRYLWHSSIAISRSKALARGYTPCSVCKP